MKKTFILWFAVLFALTGCGGGGSKVAGSWDTIYIPQYARGFSIYSLGKSSVIEIQNPWQGAKGVNNMFFVARDGETPPDGFDGVTLRGPIRRAVCMSSSHIAFMDALGCVDVVCAVSGDRYITNEQILNRVARGELKDVGYEGNINYELVATLRPDVVFMYSVAGERLPVIDKMREMNIPVVMIGEYLEPTPLGKAEWLVVFGEIFGRREVAESIFDGIALQYEQDKALIGGVTKRPKVMLNSPWKDTWFVPGDRSYMVQLLRDAGAEYACAGVDSEQSRAINGETAYMYAMEADYWLNPNEATSIRQLVGDNPNFRNIPPVVKGNVYNNNLRSTPGGGSDFWESGTVFPNRVLRDMIHIFHPELLPGHELRYFRHLE